MILTKGLVPISVVLNAGTDSIRTGPDHFKFYLPITLGDYFRFRIFFRNGWEIGLEVALFKL